MVGCMGQWVGSGQMTNLIKLELINIIWFCLNIYNLWRHPYLWVDGWVNGWAHVKPLKSNKSWPNRDNSIMDIFDILLDILLKPPQPFKGLFFLVWVPNLIRLLSVLTKLLCFKMQVMNLTLASTGYYRNHCKHKAKYLIEVFLTSLETLNGKLDFKTTSERLCNKLVFGVMFYFPCATRTRCGVCKVKQSETMTWNSFFVSFSIEISS